jgi:hypothetical protein
MGMGMGMARAPWPLGFPGAATAIGAPTPNPMLMPSATGRIGAFAGKHFRLTRSFAFTSIISFLSAM